MSRWTVRQYRAAMAWLNEQWNNPSLTDQYIMQATAAVASVGQMFSSSRRRIEIDDFRLKFTRKGSGAKEVEETAEEASRRSMAAWGAMLGVKIGPAKE
jgi:hypothetical protein